MYKSKIVKLLILFLAFTFIVSFSLFGCKKEAAPAEEEAVSPAEEVEEVAEEAEAEGASTAQTGEEWTKVDPAVSIQIGMFSGPEAEAMLPTVAYWNENYAEETGVYVSSTSISRTGYIEKIHSLLVSGVKDINMVLIMAPIETGKLVNYLEPMDEYLANPAIMSGPNGEEYKIEDMIPAALDSGKGSDGKVYMLPKDISIVIYMYRNDLISEPPETWDDYVELIREFTKSENPNSPTERGASTMAKLGLAWPSMILLNIVWSYGGELFDEEGMPTVDTEAWVNAFKFYEEVASFNGFLAGVENSEFPEQTAALQNGECPQSVHWNAAFPMLTSEELTPALFDKWSMSTPPAATAGGDPSIYLHALSLGINKATPNKEAAMKFLVWSAFGEGAELYAEAGGASPTVNVWKNGPEVLQQEYPMLEYARPVQAVEYVTDVLVICTSWLNKVVIGEATAEEAAAGFQAEAENFVETR